MVRVLNTVGGQYFQRSPKIFLLAVEGREQRESFLLSSLLMDILKGQWRDGYLFEGLNILNRLSLCALRVFNVF
jgi:hypothetical protein